MSLEEEEKYLFTDKMTVYIGNLEKHSDKLLVLLRGFSKSAGHI